MKPILRYTLLLAVIICFTTCKKDDNGASTTLPEATQEGKNTMGMKVNGEVWTPYFPCSSFSNPCGAVDLEFNQSTNYFSVHITRHLTNDFSSLIINTLSGATITNLGNKYDSIYIEYNDYNNGINTYSKSNRSKGNLIVTKIDNVNKIISGILECTLYKGLDSIIISEGRFDYKFNACLCNN